MVIQKKIITQTFDLYYNVPFMFKNWAKIEQQRSKIILFLVCGKNNIKAKVKFSFSATKICAILLMVLTFTKCQNHKEDGANFCGLLKKAELYKWNRKCVDETIFSDRSLRGGNGSASGSLVQMELTLLSPRSSRDTQIDRIEVWWRPLKFYIQLHFL